MKRFNQVMELHGDKLELYVPVVARVHGGSHPEFHSVRQVYDQMISKIEAAGPKESSLMLSLRSCGKSPTVILCRMMSVRAMRPSMRCWLNLTGLTLGKDAGK